MTFILAASGKKQSGKDTLLNGLKPFLAERGTVKVYSFADQLKTFLINGMGLRHDQVWGTDEQKNSLTMYKWEDIPKYIRWDFGGRWYFSDDGNRIQLPSSEKSTNIEEMYWQSLQDSQPTRLMSGLISARELMQLFGTDLMRRIFSDKIWVNSCISAIERENPDVALIPDMRFPSEFNPLMDKNAYIIRLMRDVSKEDQHPSETALDSWEWSKYPQVLVIPADATIDSCRQMAMDWLDLKMPVSAKGKE